MATIAHNSPPAIEKKCHEICSLIAKLHNEGVRLWAEDGKLRFEYYRPISESTWAELKARKPELLEYLRGEGRAVLLSRPASFSQARLWFLEQFSPGLLAYHVPLAIRLKGHIDQSALAAALEDVVRRHEILRTTFSEENGIPYQVVRPFGGLDWQEIGGVKDDALPEYLQTCLKEPFDLVAGPLLRVRLLTCTNDEYVCLIIMHHIICDAWSLEVLSRELLEFYRARTDGGTPRVKDLRLQYSEYSEWQRLQTHAAASPQQFAYWQKKLSGYLTQLELPSDFPRPTIKTYQGRWLKFQIDPELFFSLQRLCQQENLTLFTLLLAAFRVFLYRHTGQTDTIVGTPVAGRPTQEVEPLIGLFVNTLPLRTILVPSAPFIEVAAAEKQTLLEALSYQEVPFERLVEEFAQGRDPSRTPLAQVMFTYYKDELALERIGNATMRPMEFEWQTAKFDLVLSFNEKQEGLSGILEYSTDLFATSTAEMMVDRIKTLLRSIVGDRRVPVDRIGLLPETELQKIYAWTHGPQLQEVEPLTIIGRFAHQVAIHPTKIALCSSTAAMTYCELDRQSTVLAEHLVQHGLSRGEVVGVLFDKCIEAVVSILGVLKAGGAYLPLDPSYPKDRLKFMVKDCAAKLVLKKSSAEFEAANVMMLDVEAAAFRESANLTVRLPDSQSDDLAYVIYTSGSTGNPKGVGVENRNVIRLLDGCNQHFAITPEDVWSVFHSYAFDFSVWELWCALLYGGRAVLINRDEALATDRFIDLLQREGVTVLSQTPSAFAVLAEELGQRPKLTTLRWVVFGGEALNFSSLRNWIAQYGDEHPRLANMYGITETTVHVTFRRVTRDAVRWGGGSNIGRPLPGYATYLLDSSNGQPCPIGVPGEILVGGVGVARGYLNRDELNAERFVMRPWLDSQCRLYCSGDLARWRVDGTLEYLGRIDQQVKIRGYRIEVGEVESAIRFVANSDEVIVLARPLRGGTVLHGYWVGEPGQERKVREQLNCYLPSYMVPTYLTAVPAMPLTSNGKIDRRALPEYVVRTERQPIVPPETDLEQLVAAIWREFLPTQDFGVEDDFFELGGQSLLLMRVRSRLEKSLFLKIPAVELLQYPTIRSFSKYAASIGVKIEAANTTGNDLRALSDAAVKLGFAEKLGGLFRRGADKGMRRME